MPRDCIRSQRVSNGARPRDACQIARITTRRVKQAALAGVRTLRDYIALGSIPPELAPSIQAGPPVALHRTTLDGKHHLSLELAGRLPRHRDHLPKPRTGHLSEYRLHDAL